MVHHVLGAVGLVALDVELEVVRVPGHDDLDPVLAHELVQGSEVGIGGGLVVSARMRRPSTRRRSAIATLPATASEIVSAIRRSWLRRSSTARWRVSMTNAAPSSNVNAVSANAGALRTSRPIRKVKPALA